MLLWIIILLFPIIFHSSFRQLDLKKKRVKKEDASFWGLKTTPDLFLTEFQHLDVITYKFAASYCFLFSIKSIPLIC